MTLIKYGYAKLGGGENYGTPPETGGRQRGGRWRREKKTKQFKKTSENVVGMSGVEIQLGPEFKRFEKTGRRGTWTYSLPTKKRVGKNSSRTRTVRKKWEQIP